MNHRGKMRLAGVEGLQQAIQFSHLSKSGAISGPLFTSANQIECPTDSDHRGSLRGRR
jgi:hypothetical protein